MLDDKSIIALSALALGVWNLTRLYRLDKNSEYKKKSNLYQECLAEAKDILEKNIIESKSLFRRRIDFDLLESEYIGSHGYNAAYSELSSNFKELERLKADTIKIYRELRIINDKTDKEAFDIYINILANLKDIYLDTIENIAQAKSSIELIENLAVHLKSKT